MKRSSVAETFDEVKRLIHMFINRFHAKYRIDRDRLVSAAYYGFMQAYDSYEPENGKFTTWLGLKVNNRMMDELRNYVEAKRKSKEVNALELELLESFPESRLPDPEFDYEWFLDGLSDDAMLVAELVLFKPIDVRLVLAQLGPESPANWRQAMREYLQEIGWDRDRINKAFLEIKHSL